MNKLPFVPVNFFYFQFTTGTKRLFWVLLSAILLLGGLCLYTYHNPFGWTLSVLEVPETTFEKAKVMELESQQYRTFDIETILYRTWTNFSATPLENHPFPTIFFWIMQLTGWAFILTSATFIRSRWYLFFFFLFGLFIHASDITHAIFIRDSYHLIEFTILMSFLMLGYLFQMYTLKWLFQYRFMTFLGMLLLLFGVVYFKAGFPELHRMSVSMYPYLIILTLIFLFFIGKDPTNLVILGSTNHKNPAHRRSYTQIMVILGVLIAWELFLTLVYCDIISLKASGLKPFHLILLSAIATLFTSQNQFHSVKNILSTVSVFTFMLGGWVVLMLSFWFHIMASGDVYFTLTIEEVGVILALGVGFGHIIYLLLEFNGLLKQKLNLYYLIGQSRGFRLTLIWLFGAITLVFFQGRMGWRARTVLYHSYFVQCGDNYFLNQMWSRAADSYRDAVEGKVYILNLGSEIPLKLGGAGFSPKPNYNLAAIYAQNNQIGKALTHYSYATSYYYFPYAILNSGNLIALSGNANQAKKTWLEDLKKHENPEIANNLSYIFYQRNQPDSAIIYLKKALTEDPSLSAGYSNLAEIYWKNKKYKDAKAFTEASVDFNKPAAGAIINAIWHSVVDTMKLEIPEIKAEDNPALVHNYAVYYMRNGENTKSLSYWDNLIKDQEEIPVEAELMTAYQWFMSDSIQKAKSKIDFISAQVPSYQSRANYLMGAIYYSKGIPEMARYYFNRMAQNGDSSGYYYEALTYADVGMTDTAFAKIMALRVNDTVLQSKIMRERGMMYLSRGLDNAARTETDISAFSKNEMMRIAIYADSSGNFANALNGFRSVIQKDSSDASPYYEMLKIYLKYNNKAAIDDGEYALKKFPKDIRLQVEMAKVYLAFGQTPKAKNLINAMKDIKDPKLMYDIGICKADIMMAENKKEETVKLLKSNVESNKFRADAYLRLAEIYRKDNKFEEGYKLIYDGLNYNGENAGIWYYFAWFVKRYGIESDAKFGAIRAIELTRNPQDKAKIYEEFKDILAPEEEKINDDSQSTQTL
ncbi:MAG: hypothetical protein K1X92_12900 [Bacteroidia bacterium]|nr:hypothetical protein [Bacteroidia bacterium]